MLDKHLIATIDPVANERNLVFYRDWRITVLGPALFRLEQNKTGAFCDEATQGIWYRNFPQTDFSASEKNERLILKTEKVTLSLGKELASSFIVLNGKRVPLDNRANLLGTYRTLDRCDGGLYLTEDTKEYQPIRLEFGVVSRNGVAIYDDSDSLILKKDGTLAQRKNPENDYYVFAYGHEYREAIRALYRISGATPIIPRYALGNWWSRYHVYTDSEYLHVLDRLEKRRIPVTVATLDMDWHWSTTLDEKKKITETGKNDDFHGGADGWTGYSWNTDLFPDYKAFLKKLKERGMKVTLNLHPAMGVRWFEDQYSEMAKAMGIDPSTEKMIPFDFTSDRFINAYFRILHEPYEKDGVDFWWIDWQQGTKTAMAGLDPLWALNHYHTMAQSKKESPLILSRYCGIGSQRYPLGFSGDTFVSWKSLAYLPYFTVTASNAGYTWWSHDIGANMAGVKDDELYTRYVQLGAFLPINRLHANHYDICTKEPCIYMNGSGLIAEEFLRLRHRMIPFLYSAAVENHLNGRALMEPLYYEYPECPEAYSYRNQYLFGGQLMVIPVVKKGDRNGMTATKAWIPPGHWTDIFTGDEYEGGKTMELVRWLDSIPVLAKEGGFFVLDGRRSGNRCDLPESLEVQVYSGNGYYRFYEGQNTFLDFSSRLAQSENGSRQSVTLFGSGYKKEISPRRLLLEFRNVRRNAIVTVTADGETIPFDADTDDYLTVSFEMNPEQRYEINVAYEPQTQNERRKNVLCYSLSRIQGLHRNRSHLYRDWNKMTTPECLAQIGQLDWMTTNEKKRMTEILIDFE